MNISDIGIEPQKNEHLWGIIARAYYTYRARDGHKNIDETKVP
jgi:hypothetical protein